ncbi:hypothetical protein P3T34_000583 [Kitasatospora sp. MAP12-44]|nr:hypothetical protein [Kitasatospora sp. MAP12-44]MDH6108368.1 hypothetical protein [Kitasatospora sp. MAP12-44]
MATFAVTVERPGETPARGPGGGNPMKKMSIRKAGTIRLTSAAYYCCSF